MRLIFLKIKELIKYSNKYGVYVPSYDLAKALGKKHQNLMTTIKRNYKFYIRYYTQDHQYYKNQKIFVLPVRIIKVINKNGVYDKLIKEMGKIQDKKRKEIRKNLDRLFFKI